MRPDTVKTEEEEETQYVIVTKEDETGYMVWVKEEVKTHARVSGCEQAGANERTQVKLTGTSSSVAENHTATTQNSWASP